VKNEGAAFTRPSQSFRPATKDEPDGTHVNFHE
jgi:hypothetical protein